MKGYYKNDVETAAAFCDGWFCTGDFAFFTKQGDLVITGRHKDLIVNKGLKIYPQEVENILLMHQDIIRAAVIGFSDPSSGQVPIAFVQLKNENKLIVNELQMLCLQHLAHYKIPRKIIATLDPLPLTSTGKVDKKVLSANQEINSSARDKKA
jgi:long-chain acyl-CoA synthetase